MPYDRTRDPYATLSDTQLAPGRMLTTVTASPDDFQRYPKALTCWVPAGTSSPTITVLPAGNDDGATHVLDLSPGRNVIDWVMVRAVTAITAGVTVRRID
jgi:hypothetical protein